MLGLRVGLVLLQLFPNGGATDIVFVTVFCIAFGTAIAWCGGRCGMLDGRCRNIFCSGGGPRQPWSSGLAPVWRFHSSVPFSHSFPSLIGLLASVDVKQQSLSLSLGPTRKRLPITCRLSTPQTTSMSTYIESWLPPHTGDLSKN